MDNLKKYFTKYIFFMETLTSLPNIGKVLSERLIEVGLDTPSKLISAGAENAFIRLLTVDEGACLNELMALEGAIQGIRWHNLDETKREELKAIFDMTKAQNASISKKSANRSGSTTG